MTTLNTALVVERSIKELVIELTLNFVKIQFMNPWLLAIRPRTLPAAIAPVLIGTAMALRDGILHIPSALLACLCALFIQIGTNLANDYYDFIKGTDKNRIGPTRVTQAGLIAPQTVKKAFWLFFGLAAVCACLLLGRGGWPIAVIGIFSIISGLLYTAGPYPLGYLGLGEIFVLIFFGPVAVAGTYYVQTLDMTLPVLLAGLASGLISAAILAVNNLRDKEGDARSHKRTLAVRFGLKFARLEFALCLIGAALIPVILVSLTQDFFYSLAGCLIIVPSIPVIKVVNSRTDGPALNKALADTGKILFIYSILFSLGWILS